MHNIFKILILIYASTCWSGPLSQAFPQDNFLGVTCAKNSIFPLLQPSCFWVHCARGRAYFTRGQPTQFSYCLHPTKHHKLFTYFGRIELLSRRHRNAPWIVMTLVLPNWAPDSLAPWKLRITSLNWIIYFWQCSGQWCSVSQEVHVYSQNNSRN